jgi:hypothetical protein
MAKFHGEIGYGESVETAPGVWVDQITEKTYFGDVIRDARYLKESDSSVNKDLSVGNSLTIVADAYAYEHIFAIRYIRWMGALWTVSMVEVQRPRLLIRLGGVYHGPTV